MSVCPPPQFFLSGALNSKMFTVLVDTKSTEMDSHFLGLHGHYLDKIGVPLVIKPARLTNPRTWSLSRKSGWTVPTGLDLLGL